MLHNPQIDRPDCHDQHGSHEHLSREDMARGTFSKTNSGGPRKEAQNTTANVNNEHGEIDHKDFFSEVYVYRRSRVSTGQDVGTRGWLLSTSSSGLAKGPSNSQTVHPCLVLNFPGRLERYARHAMTQDGAFNYVFRFSLIFPSHAKSIDCRRK